MVKVSVELVRKKAEHHDRELAPLEEISLHQEGIEKIDFIQDWCPKLQILLMQSNLIPKIENLNKLKALQYLNLAMNNIEKVENLERCESLQKLDLTLNFIGEVTSITNLKDNHNLRHLYLNGNPCTDYEGYRDYVVGVLPQLHTLDNEEITRSERILALQRLSPIKEEIIKQQIKYAEWRELQKCRLEQEIKQKWRTGDEELEDEETCKRFWNEKSEHAPEVRVELDRYSRMRRKGKEGHKEIKKERHLFTGTGRPLNINEAKVPFRLFDDNDEEYILEVQVYKHLDTSFITINVESTYARIKIKEKIFQIYLPEEVNTCESEVKRSQTTGYLTITMPKRRRKLKLTVKDAPQTTSNKSNYVDSKMGRGDNKSKRELLEIGPSRNIFDFTSESNEKIYEMPRKRTYVVDVKQVPVDFVDNPDVPPLM